MPDNRYSFCCSELGLIVFAIDPKGCAARDGRVQVGDVYFCKIDCVVYFGNLKYRKMKIRKRQKRNDFVHFIVQLYNPRCVGDFGGSGRANVHFLPLFIVK